MERLLGNGSERTSQMLLVVLCADQLKWGFLRNDVVQIYTYRSGSCSTVCSQPTALKSQDYAIPLASLILIP